MISSHVWWLSKHLCESNTLKRISVFVLYFIKSAITLTSSAKVCEPQTLG